MVKIQWCYWKWPVGSVESLSKELLQLGGKKQTKTKKQPEIHMPNTRPSLAKSFLSRKYTFAKIILQSYSDKDSMLQAEKQICIDPKQLEENPEISQHNRFQPAVQETVSTSCESGGLMSRLYGELQRWEHPQLLSANDPVNWAVFKGTNTNGQKTFQKVFSILAIS